MENLISSTDNNILQFELLFRDIISRDTFIDRVITYSKFLKKPIEKNMFVPCDEFDNVLEEPLQEHYTDYTEEQNAKDWLYNLEKYNKAKERVLFKGFKVLDYKHGSLYSKVIVDSTGFIHLFWFDKITQTWEISRGLANIESLTKFGGVELTEIALKEIGLPETEIND